MALMPEFEDELDRIAFALAVEAVIGTMIQGKQRREDEGPAHDWIVEALGDSDPTLQVKARAMYFVNRKVSGPLSVT